MKIPILQTFLILTLCGVLYAEPATQQREIQLSTMIPPDFSRQFCTPDWEDLIGRRQGQLETEQRILRQLEMPVTVNIDQSLTLEQAVNMICAQVDLVPHVDRAILLECRIWTCTMVTMPRANGVRAKSVLNVILEQHGFTYTVRNEMFNITTKGRARGEKFHRMYYVGDIVNEIPEGLDFSSIMGIIQSVIEPDSWLTGDAFLTFHPTTQSLVIRQTEKVHVQIEDLLNQIRNLNDGIEPQPPQQPHQVAQPQRPQSEERIFQQLEETRLTVDEGGSLLLDQALRLLNVVGIPYFLDVPSLQEAGIQHNVLVNLSQTDEITKKEWLENILAQHDLAWVVKHEMLVITSKRAARGNKIHRLHYVGDLISDLGDLASEIMKMFDTIMTKIDPDSWRDGDAAMTFHPATLSIAVRHFEDVHAQVEDMFNRIREANGETLETFALQLEEQTNQCSLTLRERIRMRTIASPNRIIR